MKRVNISLFKWNYIKDDGTYLLDEHLYWCSEFSKGFGIVEYYDNMYNIVNEEGKILLKNNVNYCYRFDNGFTEIRINNKLYKIDKECNFFTEDNISFNTLYNEFPNIRTELIEIIEKYTYYDKEEYFI